METAFSPEHQYRCAKLHGVIFLFSPEDENYIFLETEVDF
jgi:hypothetical protein